MKAEYSLESRRAFCAAQPQRDSMPLLFVIAVLLVIAAWDLLHR